MSRAWQTFFGGAGLLALAVIPGCSTPSEKYGLPPPSQTAEPYPNINLNPAKKQVDPNLTPEQRAAAEMELERSAGKKPPAPK